MRFLVGLLTGFVLRRLIGLLVLLGITAVVVSYVRDHVDEDSLFSLAGERTKIVRAVDGDTLVVRIGGRQRRVRVLGIDTPETVKPGAAVQRCGPEASARAKQWVRAHRSVTLQRDLAAPDEDRYGRLLRYVDPGGDGRDLSTVQVAAGLARVAAYGQSLRNLDDLRAAERRAKKAGRGLWGASCAQP